MPQAEWAEVQRRGDSDYLVHNKWLAFALKQLFARPSPNTDAFESLVVNTVSTERQLDGRWLFERMQNPIIALTGKEERAKYEEFKAASYFVAGDSAVSVYAKAAVLISDFNALPELYVSQQNAVLHALLEHFEKVCPEKAEELADELAVAEAGGIAFKHTQEQLLALIATHTSKLRPLDVSAAERERGRGKPGKREIKATRTFPCNNCGNDPKGGEINHHPYFCTYKPTCYGEKRKGISGCPCGQRVAKEQRVKGPTACVLKLKERPNGNVLDFYGKAHPDYMQKWYAKGWDDAHRDGVPKDRSTGSDGVTAAVERSVSTVEGDLVLGNRFSGLYGGDETPDVFMLEGEPNRSLAGQVPINGCAVCGHPGGDNLDLFHCETCFFNYCELHVDTPAHGCEVIIEGSPVVDEIEGIVIASHARRRGVVAPVATRPSTVRSRPQRQAAVDAAMRCQLNVLLERRGERVDEKDHEAQSLALADLRAKGARARGDVLPPPPPECNTFSMIGELVRESALEVCAIRNGGGAAVEFLVDGGANMNVVRNERAFSEAEVLAVAADRCHGAFEGAATEVNKVAVFDLLFKAVPSTVTLDAALVPNARRNILSESYMYDHFGVRTIKEPNMVLDFGGGVHVPIYRRGGLYFVAGEVVPPSTITAGQFRRAVSEIAAAESNVPYGSAVTGAEQATLWSARLGVNARGLAKVLRGTTGTGLDSLTKEMRDAIDGDPIGRRARMRRQFVPRNPEDMTLKPGMLLLLDEFGPIEAPSVVDRQHKHLLAMCALTGFLHDTTGTNTTVDSWLDFIDLAIAAEIAIGNAVLRVRVDADPKLTSPGTDGRRRFEAELSRRRIKLEVCAGGHHEGIGKLEATQDPLTRRAEGWKARSTPPLGQSHLLPARRYAVCIHNLCVPRHSVKTRSEMHHPGSGPPDLTLVPPLIYGTTMAYVSAPESRGPAGDLDKRSPLAQFLGFYRGTSYLLLGRNGSILSRAPRNCVPLDELRRRDAGRSYLPWDVEEAATTASAPAAPELPESAGSSAPFASREPNLPESAGSSVFPAPTPFELTAPADMRGPPSTRLTRSRAVPNFYTPALHCFEVLLNDCTSPDEIVWSFNSLAQQLLQPEEPAIEVLAPHELSGGLDKLLAVCGSREYNFPAMHLDSDGGASSGGGECNLVNKVKTVLVKTPEGEKYVSVPQGTKAVLQDPNAEAWLDAHRTAVRVVLAIPHNCLVRKDEVPDGEPIIPCVMANAFKTDRVTGYAREQRAYYSRLAADGATQKAMLVKRGKVDDLKRPRHAQSVDQIAVFMGLSNAAVEDKEIIAIDAPNAYQQGRRSRPGAYVELPATIASEYDAPDGTGMCIYIGGPLQGEIPAGDEWDAEVEARVTDIGWTPAEGVPAMYTIVDKSGQSSEFYKNVDEFLLMAPREAPVIDATLDALDRAWGSNKELGKMKVNREAQEWRGYTFVRDRGRRALTIYMNGYLDASVARHIPDMLTSARGRPSASLPKGVTIRDLLAQLRLPPAAERDSKLDADQKMFQTILGELAFPQPVLVRCALGINMCLTVMCYPPRGPLLPEHPITTALFLAKLVLEAAYDARFDGITAGGFGPTDEDSRLRADMHAELDMSEPPPLHPEIFGDATWGAAPHDRYALAVTYNRLLVRYQLKVMRTVADHSMGAEMHPTTEAGMQSEYISEVARALRRPLNEPIVIASDSLSNARVARRQGTTVKVRHQLRRWQALTARIVRGLVKVLHVPDIQMPVDFLTKWVTGKKVDASVSYLTNGINRVPHPEEPMP